MGRRRSKPPKPRLTPSEARRTMRMALAAAIPAWQSYETAAANRRHWVAEHPELGRLIGAEHDAMDASNEAGHNVSMALNLLCEAEPELGEQVAEAFRARSVGRVLELLA